jgi:hypothetical protein
MNRSTKSRLTVKQLDWFMGETLCEKIGRAVCRAGTLPGKEFFEAWEVARRVRRRFRGGRVVDLACGHGLLAHILLLLDDSSPHALAVDRQLPANAQRLSHELIRSWPRLQGRVRYQAIDIQSVEITDTDLVVSVHACGTLTDTVLDMAVAAGARVAVLPCCHDLGRCDSGGLEGWLDGPTAVDATRAARLRQRGYRVLTGTIPEDITPKNRLLMGAPDG